MLNTIYISSKCSTRSYRLLQTYGQWEEMEMRSIKAIMALMDSMDGLEGNGEIEIEKGGQENQESTLSDG